MGDKLDDILASVGESPEVLREKAERTPECPDVSTFSRFVGGELRGRERKRVLRHVVDCHFCMAAWKSVESYGPSPAVAKPRRQTLARRPARLARSWGFWAPGGAMAAAAVVALVFLVTPDPGAHMEGYLYTGNTVRDSSAGLLRNGATVYPGNLVWLQIDANKTGFVSLFLWGHGEGTFLLQPTEVAKGQSFVFPEPGNKGERRGFRFEPGESGAHVLFLLFSKHNPEQALCSEVLAETTGPGMTPQQVEARLTRHFRVENALSFFVAD